MSQHPTDPNPSNPYAQFGQQGYGQGFGGDFVDPTPRRTSILAVISLVLSIIGCIVCIVGIPGPGAVAAILGGLAVFLIARSAGRLSGMGLAVTGIILGLLQTVLWIFAWVTIVMPATSGAQTHYIGPFDSVMKGIEKGDMAAARGLFTRAADTAITDEMIRDFATRYQAEVGAYQTPPSGMLDMIKRFMTVGQAMQSVQRQQQRSGGPPQNLMPMPATFAKGDAIVLMHADMMAIDQGGAGQSQNFKFPIINIGVLTAGGTQIWLMDEKKALQLLASPSAPTPPTPPSPPSGTTPTPPNPPGGSSPDTPAPPKP